MFIGKIQMFDDYHDSLKLDSVWNLISNFRELVGNLNWVGGGEQAFLNM